jgi:hypothetical protein
LTDNSLTSLNILRAFNPFYLYLFAHRQPTLGDVAVTLNRNSAMGQRARRAQQLATLLTNTSGTTVTIFYDRSVHLHRVIWTNGPDVAQMSTLAMRHADTVPGLDLTKLLWDRGR